MTISPNKRVRTFQSSLVKPLVLLHKFRYERNFYMDLFILVVLAYVFNVTSFLTVSVSCGEPRLWLRGE